MNRTAFVTGGTGFIGTNLIKLLISQNWEVTALYREASDRSPFCNQPVQWVKGSVTDIDSLKMGIPKNTRAVFHLAGDTNMWAKHNARQTAINVQGTQNMIEAAAQRGASVFIHTSSIAAWGNVSGSITEKTTQQGHASWINYERTKWIGERKALEGLSHDMKVVILNPANVIGPHDAKNWGRLFLALQNGELPCIANGRVSIAHVKEIARAHLAAVENGRSGERYILAGENCLFSDFVNAIANVSNIDTMPTVIPASVFRGYARLSSLWASVSDNEPTVTPELAKLMTRKNVSYSSQKAIQELDYSIPPMQKSVQDCYLWLNKEGLI
jgi:nucleoside-diphosphate-sugar epimerase